MPSTFTGDLAHDSPAAYAALDRAALSDSERDRILKTYQATARTQDISETTGSLRTPGTSFNPRPARLLLIALREIKELPERGQFACLLQKLAENPSGLHAAELSVSGDPVESITHVVTLVDDLRHAHLRRTHPQHTHPRHGHHTELLDRAGRLLAAPPPSIPTRLITLVTTAHQMLHRIVSEKNDQH